MKLLILLIVLGVLSAACTHVDHPSRPIYKSHNRFHK